MVEELLVEADLQYGHRLVEALDAADFPVVAALWCYSPDAEMWELFIGSPRVSELGSLVVYGQIREIMEKANLKWLTSRISVFGPEEPEVVDFRIHAGTDGKPFIGLRRVPHVSFGHTFGTSAYVYRAERLLPQTGTLALLVAKRQDRSWKVWKTWPCKVKVEDGFVKEVEVAGEDWRQKRAKLGVTISLRVVTNVHCKNGQAVGDVYRWTILDGRLHFVEPVAYDVKLLGSALTSQVQGA
jgi:hypothetical protein